MALSFVITVSTVSISTAADTPKDAFHWSSLLKKGVNISECLEAYYEGQWGVSIEEDDIEAIKNAGFNSIRLPIRWNAHAGEEAPYKVDPAFFARIDQVSQWALDRGLVIVLDFHHYWEFLREDHEGHKDRFFAIWEQLAEHYKNWPSTLYFEVMNEPHGLMTAELWNTYQNEAISIIRKTNPNRAIVVSQIKHSSVTELNNLNLPENDRNLIVTFHCYAPHGFTHQDEEENITWGSKEDKEEISDLVATAVEFGNNANRPLWLGEFGVRRYVAIAERLEWAAYVRAEAEKHRLSWAYWGFCSSLFGLYDQETKQWIPGLIEAFNLR